MAVFPCHRFVLGMSMLGPAGQLRDALGCLCKMGMTGYLLRRRETLDEFACTTLPPAPPKLQDLDRRK